MIYSRQLCRSHSVYFVNNCFTSFLYLHQLIHELNRFVCNSSKMMVISLNLTLTWFVSTTVVVIYICALHAKTVPFDEDTSYNDVTANDQFPGSRSEITHRITNDYDPASTTSGSGGFLDQPTLDVEFQGQTTRPETMTQNNDCVTSSDGSKECVPAGKRWEHSWSMDTSLRTLFDILYTRPFPKPWLQM